MQQEIDTIQVAVPMPEAIRALRLAEASIEDTLLGASVQLIEANADQLLRQTGHADLILEMAHSPWSDAFQGFPSSSNCLPVSQRLGRTVSMSSESISFGPTSQSFERFSGASTMHSPRPGPFCRHREPINWSWWGSKLENARLGAFCWSGAKRTRKPQQDPDRSPLDLADRALSDEAGLRRLAPNQQTNKTLWLEGVHKQPGQLLPIFKPVLNGSELFNENPPVVEALTDRQNNTHAFLSLLESNDKGRMEEVFPNSRALSQSKAGARALNPLIAPYLSRARSALNRGRLQGEWALPFRKPKQT